MYSTHIPSLETLKQLLEKKLLEVLGEKKTVSGLSPKLHHIGGNILMRTIWPGVVQFLTTQSLVFISYWLSLIVIGCQDWPLVWLSLVTIALVVSRCPLVVNCCQQVPLVVIDYDLIIRDH